MIGCFVPPPPVVIVVVEELVFASSVAKLNPVGASFNGSSFTSSGLIVVVVLSMTAGGNSDCLPLASEPLPLEGL